MIHFLFSEHKPTFLFLKGDTKEDIKNLNKLCESINLIDPICYLPTFTGIPYTQDFIWKYVQPTGDSVYYCSIGLWQIIYKWLKTNNIEFDGLLENNHLFKREIKHSLEEFKQIVDDWGLKYTPRPYQYEAAYKILQWKMSVSELATRAGKTLISYMIFRYAMEYLNVKNILMIVPSIDLVKQAFSDFKEYQEFFKTDTIWSGGKMVESSNLTVGTFQSLIKYLDKKDKKYDPDFYNKFDLVFVDETHRATANQIKTIISQPFMKSLKLGFGMTGTLPSPNTIPFYCLHSLLGAKIQEIKPKELMDNGYISEIQIYQHRIEYSRKDIEDLWIKTAEYCLGDYIMIDDQKHPDKKIKDKLDNPKFLYQFKRVLPYGINAVKENLKDNKKEYIKILKKFISSSTSTNGLVIEKMMLHVLDERIDYLCNDILSQCPKNTLILAHHVEYIKYIVEVLEKRFPNRHIEIVTGSINSKKRDKVKETLKNYNDCILVASYACMSTGITLSNLCYGVLFESFKSNVVNMQSLGRGLGLSDMKEKYIVHDIIDILPTKKIFLQGREKIKIYEQNNYPYTIIKKTI